MKITEDISNKIDLYLNGGLNEAEASAFEQLIAANPELAKEVELQEMVNDTIFDNGLLEYKDKIAGDLTKINAKRYCTKFGLIGFGVLGALILTYVVWPENKVEKYREEPMVVDLPNNDSIVKIATHTGEEHHESYNAGRQVTNPVEEFIKTGEDSTLVDTFETKTITVNPISENDDNNIVVEKVNNCDNTSITASIGIDEPCNDEKTGTLKFVNIKGGIDPYRCTIDQSKTYVRKNTFTDLAAGTYYLAIQDANGCTSVINKEYKLNSRECVMEHAPTENTFEPAKGFSPDYEKWIYKDSEGRNFDLQIYNKRGELVKEFNLTTLVEWDGTNNSLQRVETGLYVYIVKIEGSVTKKGTVTVMN